MNKNQPQSIGPWKVGERLGKGGGGTVFTASRNEGELAAVKWIELSYPKKRARFIQEVKTHELLTKMAAPHVIPLLDHNLEEIAGSDSAVQGWLAMPIAVCSLQDRYSLYRLRTEFCLETFLGIVSGIRSAHQRGIIHRDIKPGNILFLDESMKQPMVSDFGICFLKETQDSERVTEQGETVGARFFMAPEQERGDVTDVTESADVYALGKLLHFMITSRRLEREYLEEAFQATELNNDERLHLVRDRLLARTIVRDPQHRLRSAAELYEVASEITDSWRRRR